MDPQTATSVINSPAFTRGPRIEVFTEHVLKDKNGNVTRKVGPQQLQAIAQDALKRYQASGNLAAFGPGHTFDDEYEVGKDGRPRLLRKFPETDQPPIWGYLDPNYQLVKRPGDGRYALYANTYVRRELEYPESGVMRRIAGPEAFSQFPHRSPEYYANQNRISYVALLRREPKLDMGIAAYAKACPELALYGSDGASLVAARAEYGSLIRYAIGVDQLMAFPTATPSRYEPEPEIGDPTKPPTDTNAELGAEVKQDVAGEQAAAAGAPPPPAAEGLPPEHAHAAEEYAKHTFGMHHSRAKHLMHRYAASCGMQGDMMAPMEAPPQRDAMSVPSGTNAAPPAPASPPAPVHAPMVPHTPKPGVTRMQKNSYEERIAALETKLRETEAAARYSKRYATFDRLHEQGYDIDVDEHFNYAKDFPDAQFDKHVELLAKSASANGNVAPISDGAPIDNWRQDPANAGVPQRYKRTDPNQMNERELNDRLDYMRVNGIGNFEDACEKYDKAQLNGNGKVR